MNIILDSETLPDRDASTSYSTLIPPTPSTSVRSGEKHAASVVVPRTRQDSSATSNDSGRPLPAPFIATSYPSQPLPSIPTSSEVQSPSEYNASIAGASSPASPLSHYQLGLLQTLAEQDVPGRAIGAVIQNMLHHRGESGSRRDERDSVWDAPPEYNS